MNTVIKKADGSLVKGSVVRYKDTWMGVTAVFKTHVNLGIVYGSKTLLKKIPLSEVKEDYDNWEANWQKSETYRCM